MHVVLSRGSCHIPKNLVQVVSFLKSRIIYWNGFPGSPFFSWQKAFIGITLNVGISTNHSTSIKEVSKWRNPSSWLYPAPDRMEVLDSVGSVVNLPCIKASPDDQFSTKRYAFWGMSALIPYIPQKVMGQPLPMAILLNSYIKIDMRRGGIDHIMIFNTVGSWWEQDTGWSWREEGWLDYGPWDN